MFTFNQIKWHALCSFLLQNLLDKLNMTTEILVPGGAGFIGSHCVIELIKAGYVPIVVDNLSNSSIGKWITLKKEMFFLDWCTLECLKRVEQITGKQITNYIVDCLDLDALRDVFKKHSIYAIINFAALKSVGESVEKPVLYYKNNVGALINLLVVRKQTN